MGSAERIKHVARLVSTRGCNIIVLSAMAGTTNTLVDICNYLYKKNQAGARETVNAMQSRYEQVIAELFNTPSSGTRGGAMMSQAATEMREKATADVNRCLSYIRSLIDVDFTETDEKEILAQGELMSTALMLAYLKFTGVNAAMLPALKFMRTDENGERPTSLLRTIPSPR